MNSKELRDLIAAWVALSFAFGNLLGGLEPFSMAVAAATAGTGFLLHELAHRLVARKFGLPAHFEADYPMLFFAIMASFAGFIFAAPGAVISRGARSPRTQALISAAGPATNAGLALVFLAVPGTLGSYGFTINAWLALFNMIPFGGLDGQSVLKYSKPMFAIMVGVSAFLVFVL